MEKIASGYMLAEAPVAAPGGGVFFSDALGGGVHRWSPGAGEVETVIPKRRGVGGMALHADGGLVVSGRDVSHFTIDGVQRVLYAESDVGGFNDLTVDAGGRVVAGILRYFPFGDDEPVPGEFLRIEDGAATVVMPGVMWVNGCAFSPGGEVFYGCDYARGVVLAVDVRDDGTYGESRVLVEAPGGQVDGMAVDEDGALWVALGARGTVGRFTPEGGLDSELDVPAAFVSSVCFGGPDGRDLFITTLAGENDPGGVFLTRAPVAGVPVPAVK